MCVFLDLPVFVFVSVSVFEIYMYLYLYLCLYLRSTSVCICIWVCIWDLPAFVFVFVFYIYLYPWLFFDRFSPCIFPRPANTQLMINDKILSIISTKGKGLLGMSECMQGMGWFAKEARQGKDRAMPFGRNQVSDEFWERATTWNILEMREKRAKNLRTCQNANGCKQMHREGQGPSQI